MGIGLVIGGRGGEIIGARVGAGRGTNPLINVTKDAVLGRYAPANASEWATTLAVAGIASGGPSFLWNLQDAASPAAEALGTGVTLATGGVAGTFAQAIAGASRKGWAAPAAQAGRLLSTNASLPNPASTSALALVYLAVTSTPGQLEELFSVIGSTTTVKVTINTTLHPIINDGANTATGTALSTNTVIPIVVRYNKTAGTCTMFTLVDKISPTFTAAVGQALAIGEVANIAAPMWCGYYALFTGAAAEMTDAQIKKLEQTLAWSPSWV